MTLFEQTRVGGNGFAVTLLWAEFSDTSDEEDEMLPELGPPRFV